MHHLSVVCLSWLPRSRRLLLRDALAELALVVQMACLRALAVRLAVVELTAARPICFCLLNRLLAAGDGVIYPNKLIFRGGCVTRP